MCGIAGILHSNGSPTETPGVVAAMLDRLRHRGPDGSGEWSENGIELGHRRLAILDVTPAGRQPMESASGRFVVTFNGEIYNHDDLKRELGLRAPDAGLDGSKRFVDALGPGRVETFDLC